MLFGNGEGFKNFEESATQVINLRQLWNLPVEMSISLRRIC